MKALLLEDQFQTLDAMSEILENANFDTICCTTAEEVDNYLTQALANKDLMPDILIFVIDLCGISGGNVLGGVHTAAKWYTKIRKPPLLFLTRHFDEKAVLNAIKLASLPINNFFNKADLNNEEIFLERVFNALDRYNQDNIAEWIVRSDQKIGFKIEAGTYEFIGQNDIVFVETVPGNSNHTLIHLENKESILVKTNIGPVGRFLNINFVNIVQIYRSLFVNISKIQKICFESMIFTNGRHTMMNKDGATILREKKMIFRAKEPKTSNML